MHNTGLKSALYVDFDNVYGALKRSSLAAAEAFARNPADWLGWFELGGHEDSDDAPPRRILSRRCYLNPAVFGRYRHRFTIAGFHTIDCPALTSFGKNSADISMALDIMEALQRDQFDEFIILSADADFTPLLLRLREYDRRTAVLSTEITAQALKSAADFAFDDESFISEALGVEDSAPVRNADRAGANVQAPIADNDSEVEFVAGLLARKVQANKRPVPLAEVASLILSEYPAFKDSSWLGYGRLQNMVRALTALRPELRITENGQEAYLEFHGGGAARADAAAPAAAPSSDEFGELREQILDYVEDAIRQSDGSVHGAGLGQRIIQRFGTRVKLSDWLGEGSLSRLIQSGNRPNLAVAGYEVYDPARQGTSEALQFLAPGLGGLPEDLVDFIEELSSVGWPRIGPAQTALIIRETARLIGEGVTERNPLSGAVRDAIRDAAAAGEIRDDLQVSRSSVNYLLNSLIFDGVVFGEDCASEEDLRRELYKTLMNLIANRIGPPDEKTEALVDRLLSGGAEQALAAAAESTDDGYWRPPVAPAWADVVASAAGAGEAAAVPEPVALPEPVPVSESDDAPPFAAFSAGDEKAAHEDVAADESEAEPAEPVALVVEPAAEENVIEPAEPEPVASGTHNAEPEELDGAIWSSPRRTDDEPKRRARGGWWQRYSGD